MSSTHVSEDDLRDRLLRIADTVSAGDELDEDELQRVSREAFQLSSDAKKLR